jgi:hypothetical protein
MSPGSIVNFEAYRHHEKVRKETSNAIRGLTVSVGLSSLFIKTFEDSKGTLPDLFPNVPHIKRLNLSATDVRDILDNIHKHLGAMGVPYTLGVHEDYMNTCLTLLEKSGCATNRINKSYSSTQHEEFQKATNQTFDSDSLLQFHMLRIMRNAQIHAGGVLGTQVVDLLKEWSPSADAAWQELTGSSPARLKVGDKIDFGSNEIFVALATTKSIAREANQFLQEAVGKVSWADLVVEDFLNRNPKTLNRADTLKKLNGIARFDYENLKLTESEIELALARNPLLATRK